MDADWLGSDVNFALHYMIYDPEGMERVVRKVLYRNRLSKEQLFMNTKMRSIAYARYHFFYLAFEEGFRLYEIQRYCERYGWPVTQATIIYGINKFRNADNKDDLFKRDPIRYSRKSKLPAGWYDKLQKLLNQE